jgi:hypothetical protein
LTITITVPALIRCIFNPKFTGGNAMKPFSLGLVVLVSLFFLAGIASATDNNPDATIENRGF